MDMYKQATKSNLTFNTVRGYVTVMDLWSMPLQSKNGFNLDAVAKELNTALKTSIEESFVSNPTSEDKISQLKFDIVLDIIKDKLAEKELRSKAVETKAHNDKINQLISKKQDEDLENMSIEALMKLRK